MALDIQVICFSEDYGNKVKDDVCKILTGTNGYIENRIIVTNLIKDENKIYFHITWFTEEYESTVIISCYDWYMGYILSHMVLKDKEIEDKKCSGCENCTCNKSPIKDSDNIVSKTLYMEHNTKESFDDFQVQTFSFIFMFTVLNGHPKKIQQKLLDMLHPSTSLYIGDVHNNKFEMIVESTLMSITTINKFVKRFCRDNSVDGTIVDYVLSIS